jgi:ketosteroid isomerase-like protein
MSIKPNAFPDTVSAPVRKLLEEFYHLSNAASSHTEHEKDEQKLVSLFAPDGVYEFAGKKNKGHEAILAFRAQLFSNIEHRDHPVVKVYSFGTDDKNLLALGEVVYRDPAGGSHKEEWAGRYIIVQHDGEFKFKHVQIFIASNLPLW